MLDNSPESRTLINACWLIEEMQNELRHVLSFSGDQRSRWHAQNEVRLAQLLQFAEQARLSGDTYERIRKNVCMLYKPLTGAVEISADDIGRISALLREIDNEGFCCWTI
ncbi:hypothetical protein INH39_08585 [Massilia violaceinigra]|uniref:Uncharacterized protein n=1 Tax=Massilia violaceinigra TaxID=2045208 RepID=A0ABY4ADR7_9BURK|nr:hypothetical protein [Massilia violaceinigra]UOD31721.1 hypothetical protein INH39_08585 [Massilia violaceinigra]